MDYRLLKEFISLLVEDSATFNLKKFNSLPLSEKISYARKFLPLISEQGGGRIVFEFNSDLVLKIAKSNEGFADGISQNKKELEMHPRLSKLNIVPKIEAADRKKFEWILYEKVEILNSKDDIQLFTDLYWDELEEIFGVLLDEFSPDQILNPHKYPDLQEAIEEETDYGSPWRKNKTTRALLKAVALGISSEELLVPTHYGVNKKGNLVIVDFGF